MTVLRARRPKPNPYFRDYLYNWAAMMYEAKQTAEMIPIVHRLVETGSKQSRRPAALHVRIHGHLGRHEGSGGEEVGDRFGEYYGQARGGDAAAAGVHGLRALQTNRTLLAGTVENRAKDARAFSIDFEFLGKDGAVVQKATGTVASVAPGATGNFKVEVPMGGVYGVRYAAAVEVRRARG